MSEFTPKGVDDLGGPALSRLRELAAQVEKADALARSLRAEALRFVQALDLLGVDVPKQLRVVARATAKTKTPVPDGERRREGCLCADFRPAAGAIGDACPSLFALAEAMEEKLVLNRQRMFAARVHGGQVRHIEREGAKE